MLIQDGCLQTMKFPIAQRISQGSWVIQVILLHPGGIWA